MRFDHLVIGSGLAGLTYALEASRSGSVCVLTKAGVFESNTSYAQGGIAAAVGEADSWELHERDTLEAGAGLCDREAVRFLVQRAPEAIQWLQDLGAKFDRRSGTGSSSLALGREGGHSRNRIVKHADRTGWEIERAMVEAIRSHRAIVVMEEAFVTQLLVEDGRCFGAHAHVGELGERLVLAPRTMLATGGCGRLYQHTTNPAIATGDGIALASEAGAAIDHMEFMQFHPTTLYHPQLRSFLVSEAIRGAGGTLRNHLGRRFMYDYDERLELAPRDVVARAIDAEIRRLGTWCVYLDVTHLPVRAIRDEFPTIYGRLASIGLEIEKDWIPVVPAQHYSCGGVVTDLEGCTSVAGLYAAGEVASTGVHGANRLASNSLLEALVFARAAAASDAAIKAIPENPTERPIKCVTETDSIQIRKRLQRTMTEHVGIVRSNAGLQRALEHVRELKEEYKAAPSAPFSSHPLETWNLLVTAEHVVKGALERKQNIGLHYNEDLVSGSARSSSAAELLAAEGEPTAAGRASPGKAPSPGPDNEPA
jgi:L-aspartate oxidase